MATTRTDWAGVPGWAQFRGFPQAWDWAVREYDRGRPAKLAELVACGFEMTPEVRVIVADILAGRRKINLKRFTREKCTPEQARVAVREVEHLREKKKAWLADAEYIADHTHENTESIRRQVAGRGYKPNQDLDPARVRDWINDQYDKAVTALAARYGISKRTLDDLVQPSDARTKAV